MDPSESSATDGRPTDAGALPDIIAPAADRGRGGVKVVPEGTTACAPKSKPAGAYENRRFEDVSVLVRPEQVPMRSKWKTVRLAAQ